MPEKQATRIAQEPTSETPATDSTSEADDQRAANATRSAEILLQLPQGADFFWAWDHLCRNANMKPIRGASEKAVYEWIVRNTAGYHSWQVPSEKAAQEGRTSRRAVLYHEIAYDMGVGKKTVGRCLKRLELKGRVHVQHLGLNGGRDGCVITLLLPEAQKRRANSQPKAVLAGQEALDVNPQWLKDVLAVKIGEQDMSVCSSFVLTETKKCGLLESEGPAFVEAALSTTATAAAGNRIEQGPVQFFRGTLRNLLRQRGESRVPPAQSARPVETPAESPPAGNPMVAQIVAEQEAADAEKRARRRRRKAG